MKVLVWLWSHGGGGSQFALNLARRLGRDFGKDSVALSLNAADPTAELAVAAGIEVRRAEIVSHRKRALQTLTGLPHAASVIKAHAADADIVVAAMNFATLAPLAMTLKRPLVYCAHDPLPHTGDYAALAQRASQALILRRADMVVAHSDFAAGLLRRQAGIGAKLRVAPLQSVFEPAPASEARAAGPTRLLFAGRMIAYKGGALLADALDLIRDRDDWRLAIVGAGPAMSEALRRRFDHPQIETLRTEFVSYADLAAYYRGCDVAIAPYIDASQSGVVAEALAHGKPCLVTPVGALAEQIGDGEGGWVADAVTARALAAKLIEIIEHDRTVKAAGAARLAEAHWRADSWRWLAAMTA